MDPGKLTVAQYLKRWLADCAKVSVAAKTYERYEEIATRHLIPALGGPEPVVTGEWRIGDVRHIVADPAAAANSLGYRARVPFETGIAEFAERVMS